MLKTLRSSVRRKVILLVLAATVSALALSALALVIYDLRTYEMQWTNDLNTQAEILARANAFALASKDRRTATADLSPLKIRPRVLAAALYTRDGDLLATYTKAGLDVPPFPTKPEADGYRIEGDQLVIFRRVMEGGQPLGTVYLKALYLPWERVRDYLTIVGVVMLASLALAAALSAWLQKAVTVPILEVAHVAREVMAQRDYSLRARKITDDEIGELVDSFNAQG